MGMFPSDYGDVPFELHMMLFLSDYSFYFKTGDLLFELGYVPFKLYNVSFTLYVDHPFGLLITPF
ncbi:unnamed protein product [Meloidogyne enterolobii]|uniref:Uncharacterized protein n=1 Tax=Meloidogyne enterolobii TaxID=390850 RepID=A0ACB0YQ36_MELEN